MSYAIIRNEKYTKEKMLQISPHNERQKKSYSNKNIDKNNNWKQSVILSLVLT